MAQARTIARKQAPGKIACAEYECEDGGWRYSFDSRQGKRIHEVGIDANTGRIVEDTYEGLHGKD
ncbi:MAG: PepSY domain-containing protein [Pseudomonadota bacterium]|nr:PepSY domain-containing protein [Pseudomonadota bacterium]